MSGVERIEDGQFIGVQPGTQVTFRIQLDPNTVPERAESIRIPARIFFRAFGRTRLDRRRVEFLIPGDDGVMCP